MGQLSLTLLRWGFLALLWALVLSAVAVLRADIYGTRITVRGRGLSGRIRTSRSGTLVAPARTTTGLASGRSRVANRPYAVVVIAGPLVGTTIPLGDAPVSIGRSPTSTLVIDDDYCSARHARIYRDGESWWVEDLGSTNGTFLGDARLYDPVEVRPGTRIRLGATELEVRES